MCFNFFKDCCAPQTPTAIIFNLNNNYQQYKAMPGGRGYGNHAPSDVLKEAKSYIATLTPEQAKTVQTDLMTAHEATGTNVSSTINYYLAKQINNFTSSMPTPAMPTPPTQLKMF
jgi:hypothetical protein